MRFGFVTCVQLGLSCMEAIYEAGGKLNLAITLSDEIGAKKAGRVYLDDFCSRRAIPLKKVRNINDEDAREALRGAQLDWLFIIGWSQIAGADVLSLPRGALGMHPTLLPIGRGRAAIPWTILHGLLETGVTLFKMDEGVDTGAIVDQIKVPVAQGADAEWLYGAVNDAHVTLMRSVIPLLEAEQIELRPQDDSKATVWPGRRPEDGRIDFDGSVLDAERLIRATTRPYPGAFFVRERKKVIVWRAKLLSRPAHAGKDLVLKFRDGWLLCTEWAEEPADDSY